MDVGAEASDLVPGIFALEVDEAVDGVEASGAFVRVVSAVDEGEDGLVDVDPARVLILGARIVIVVVVKDLLGQFCMS